MTKLTLEEVLEMEKHQLSYNKSAYLLGVNVGILCRFCHKHKIEWSGKCAFRQKGEKEADSLAQKIKEKGLKHSTVTMRLYRGWSMQDALNTPVRSKKKKRYFRG